jgi:hypothetical protein
MDIMSAEDYQRYCDDLIRDTVAVDFDGVLMAKGGDPFVPTLEPLPNVEFALKALSNKFSNVVVHTCRALEDRPVGGKAEVWAWLEKYNLDYYVAEVTAIKPRAAFYIDDKAVRHTGCWDITLGTMGIWGPGTMDC